MQGPRAFWRVLPALLTLACAGEEMSESPPAHVESPVTEAELTRVVLSPRAEERLGIEVTAATERTVHRTRTLGGELMVPSGRDITVTAPVAGTVLGAEGGRLPAGGTRLAPGAPVLNLVALSPDSDLRRTQAEVSAAEARMENARTKLERARELLADNAVTLAEFQDAETEFITAEAESRSLRARFDLLAGGEAPSDLSELSPLAIPAPSGGIIDEVFVAVGQTVAAGAPLFRIENIDPLWVKVPVYGGDLRTMDRTEAVLVSRSSSNADPDARQARPITAPRSANVQSASIDLYYELPNADLHFRPGERVAVAVRGEGDEEGLIVPWSSVVIDLFGGQWVYVKTAEHTFTRRRVAVATVAGADAVIARGLSAGEQVVSVGAAELFSTEFGPAGH